MREDDGGTSNLIAFPGSAADAASTDAALSAPSHDRDLIRRLETIAATIGVPVATFLRAAQARADRSRSENGTAAPSQTAELLRLFGRIGDGRTRDQCLSLLRMLAAGDQEPRRSR